MSKKNVTFRLIVSLFVVFVVFMAFVNNSVAIASQNDPISHLLTFEPIEESFRTDGDTTGCPVDFPGVGTFRFDARLKNVSKFPVFELEVKVTELTNENLLQNADGGPGGVGSTLAVQKIGNFSDGKLAPGELVDVHFIICLKNFEPFRFFVDLFGKFGTGAPVPKTGQTISFATGDDGDLEKGVAWSIPRFTDNGDGTITDNLTLLIWDKEANRFGARSWNSALSDCNNLAANGVDLTDGSTAGDWHLANVKELESFIHYGAFNPPVLPDTLGTGQWKQGDPFDNVQTFLYWSSTSDAKRISDAWYVELFSGFRRNTDKSGSSSLLGGFFVWCVRGEHRELETDAPVAKTGQITSYGDRDDGDLEKGVAWPNPRFTDNGDGTITDNLTHLIWDKDANRFGRGFTERKIWEEALTDCNQLEDNGVDLTDGSAAGDWHLPNAKELVSLIHYGVFNPAVPDTLGTGQWKQGEPFDNVQSDHYWSSTTVAFDTLPMFATPFAWYVFFDNGVVRGKDTGFERSFVWCVRGGK